MRKKLLCLCTAVLLDLCFLGNVCRLAGPHRVYTKKLLDGLRERGVKASFFLVGENIPGNEELVRQMAKDGHLIGVHCMAHVDLARQPIEKSVEEIRETADWIEAVTGKRPDVDTLDWKSRNTARIVKHICKNAAVHTVVLMHDAYQTSVDAALETIDTLTAEGYTFVTIEECLID